MTSALAPCTRSARSAVTLAEVLVVVGVIGILMSLLLPAVQQVRAAAHRTACQNHLRQIALAAHHFESVHGYLPPGARLREHGRPESLFGDGLTWLAFILPHIEQDALWRISLQAYRVNPDPQLNPPHSGLATVIRTFTCPADGRLTAPVRDSSGRSSAYSSYLGVRGNLPSVNGVVIPNGVLVDGYDTVRLLHVTDGTSNTLMIGERPPDDQFDVGWWYTYHTMPAGDLEGSIFIESAYAAWAPYCQGLPGPGGVLFRFGPGRTDNPCDKFHFWSLHGGGANFAFADASVRFLPYAAIPVMHALASRNGGETVDLAAY